MSQAIPSTTTIPGTTKSGIASSNRHVLHCRMQSEPAGLERLCRVVRVRGFRIASMSVESSGGHFNIALTLEGSRPISMLQSQLLKLHTVGEVVLGAQQARSVA
ncbi:acetolactate synthase small subunit [Marinobacter sp. LV10R520-4]|uniref:ACT domain-containing protein n=1 Tax=Marinobacter sp. LV10R520-4 TaxID=1761796 RepID=UPI000C00AF82|nr:ACT domain-containing protein [Marinobacter sp. LV10R520-4]PFG51270.1 acetolactate synthase small subunit [Marinobacter sp. LV10R520-4]